MDCSPVAERPGLPGMNRAQADFLAQMSHDLHTPMNAIIGMTRLALDSAQDADTRACLQQIDRSGHELLDLLNDLLDLVCLESGRLLLHPAWTPAADLLQPCLDRLAADPAHKGLPLRCTLPDDWPDIRCRLDVARTRQLFALLLDNALLFAPAGCKATLTGTNLQRDGSHRVDQFVLQATGGVKAAFLSRAPVSAQQGCVPGQAENSGAELRLSLARTIAEAMGGTVTAQSVPGRGCVLVLTLPCRYCPIRAETTEEWPGLAGRRILVAEDQPLNRTIVTRLLEKRGVLVETAPDGAQALARFRTRPPHYYDAVLMDIQMPVLDGLAATRALRALPRPDSRLPIVALTANTLAADVRACLAAGMDAHLAKPIDPRLLYDTLERQIEQSAAAVP